MNWKTVVSFVIGMAAGVFVAWVVPPRDPERYVLTRDLDLQRTYLFEPKSSAPVRGVIKAGSEFEVDSRHSLADYIVFRSVVERKKLMEIARPISNTASMTGMPQVESRKRPQ